MTTQSQFVKPIIAYWLGAVSLMIVLIVLVGGLTRLTQSGLSMIEWRPLMGVLPPLNHGEWMRVFQLYQHTPEYTLINQGMSLADFKAIFFWEYVHRMLGRCIGLLIIIPYLFFLFKGYLSPKLKRRGVVMIALVVGQGLLGWYMVQSGLIHRPDVSHYRLAAHLLLALFLLQYVCWTLYDVVNLRSTNRRAGKSHLFSGCITLLICIQITYGAFVAGLGAGYGYNTFPKMGQAWVPDAVFSLTPLWVNLLENKVMLQWIHRGLAWVLLIAIMCFWGYTRFFVLNRRQAWAVYLLLLAVAIQFLLGVVTILSIVPISLAVLHQLGAVILFSVSVFTVYQFYCPQTTEVKG